METQIHFSIPRLSLRSTPHRHHNFQSSLQEEFLAAEIRILCKATEKFTERPTKIQTKMMMKSMDRVALGEQQTTRKSARRTKRRMRGGYRDNISLTNIASTGAPFSGTTARAHNWVGGRRRKRRTRRTRSRRH